MIFRCTGLALAIGLLACGGPSEAVVFKDISAEVNLDRAYTSSINTYSRRLAQLDYKAIQENQLILFSGGLAIGDINGDYKLDLFFVAGQSADNVLLVQQPDGRFQEAAGDVFKGLNNGASSPNAAVFTEVNGDGVLDLIVGELRDPFKATEKQKTTFSVFLGDSQKGHIGFKASDSHGLKLFSQSKNIAGISFADIDGDGDLDLFAAHWDNRVTVKEPHLWINQEQGFESASLEYGFWTGLPEVDFSFTPIFSDINGDNLSDLLLIGDFETSQVFLNKGQGRYRNATNPMVIEDQNGMGGSAADFDNDGDIDWFVTAIYDPSIGRRTYDSPYGHWGGSGNRLYDNDGSGRFKDITSAAGLRDGSWGWGSCAADFNNDGYLDIYQATGFGSEDWARHFNVTERLKAFYGQPSKLFISRQGKRFTEVAAASGLNDTFEGRAVTCFDYGRDGDIDILVTAQDSHMRLYENTLRGEQDTPEASNFIGLVLKGDNKNPYAVGAKIFANLSNGSRLMREIKGGGSFLTQEPMEAHFGLGAAKLNDIEIVWPDSSRQVIKPDISNQWLVVYKEPKGKKAWDIIH